MWPYLAAKLAYPLTFLAGDVNPVSNASSAITTYLLSYGPLGLFALLAGWVLYRGLLVPSKTAQAAVDLVRADMTAAVERVRTDTAATVAQARADLLEENRRLIARAEKAEEQRDAAMAFTQANIVPLLLNFTSVSQNLLPLLQRVVDCERDRHRPGG